MAYKVQNQGIKKGIKFIKFVQLGNDPDDPELARV